MKRIWVLGLGLLLLGTTGGAFGAATSCGVETSAGAAASIAARRGADLLSPLDLIAGERVNAGGYVSSEAHLYAETSALGQGRGNGRGEGQGGGRGEGQGEGHGNAHRGPSERGRGRRSVQAGFTSHEQYLIRRYFREETSNLPPGLAKRGGNLPPGLERHLEKYGTLPPGLQKRLEPFPARLARELPPLPNGCGCRRVILGDRALIIDTANRILDMFLYR